jgi:replicative DNA helicase
MGPAGASPDKEDRLPPHSTEAEQGVLGCILLAPNECLPKCIERFRAGSLMFYDLRHQTIYAALLAMNDAFKSIDLITLQQFLKDQQNGTQNSLEAVGGLSYLADLPNAVPSAANLEYYLEIVREKFVLRRMIATCTEIVSRAYEFQGDADKLMDEVERDLGELTETETQGGEVHIKQALRGVMDKLEGHYARGSTQLDGLPTGPAGNYLDKMLGGIAGEDSQSDEGADYGVIAGRPGTGKTSFAMNIVEFLANDFVWWRPAVGDSGEPLYHPLEEGEEKPRPVMEQMKGIPVAVFSIEMTTGSLVMRMLFSRGGVDMAQWKQGFGKKGDDMKLVSSFTQLSKSNIYIDATPAQTIGQIAAKARRMVRQYGIKLFVLDYLQLVEHDGGNGMDRVREITKISRKIMALKKQLKVPWIVIAQMNRDIEKSERPRAPVMSDLKDCGAIEQDADWVIFTYKTPRSKLDEPNGANGELPSDQEIIDKLAEDRGWEWSRVPYRVDLVLAKHRDGPVGEAQMVFLKNLSRFQDWHQFKVQHGVEGAKKGEAAPKEGEL